MTQKRPPKLRRLRSSPLCPACRSIKQAHATKKCLKIFDANRAEDLKLMTLLLPIEKDASAIPVQLNAFRYDLHNRLAEQHTLCSPPMTVRLFAKVQKV